MPSPGDFRAQSFDVRNIVASGRFIGDSSFWKLFVLENSLRILVFSVLSVQIGPHWWNVVADANIQNHVSIVRRSHSKKKIHTSPGGHDIYCIFMSDIITIMRNSAHHIRPIVPEIDGLIVDLENIKIPRNLVGHMNWLKPRDRGLIRSTYFNIKRALTSVANAGIVVRIP